MHKSKSALFLMELIIVIFFFALTSAVCLRVFVKAHDVASETEGLNYAILWADNAGECFREFGPDEAKIKSLLDADFNLTDYAYSLDFSEDNSFFYMDYRFTYSPKDTEVYSFKFKQHKKEVSR
ncbi:MAG: hypothetical protein ILP13_07285 [Lachnospiraceae bacterium]|nr:hypothetical protein [Lachnospiraceae bacterium]